MKNVLKIKTNKTLKALIVTLELLALGLIIYLAALPLYPAVKYRISWNSGVDFQDINTVKKIVEETLSPNAAPEPLVFPDKPSGGGPETVVRPAAKNAQTLNRLSGPGESTQRTDSEQAGRVIIPKIGVNAPIIDTDDEKYGLSKGVWRIPESSTPDKGGNTVLTGHRFKYLPPSNLTFYLFHKLEKGDITSVVWDKKIYYYRVKEIKIVGKDDVSILKPAKKPTLTMFTCDPIYSTKNRLVIISELIKIE